MMIQTVRIACCCIVAFLLTGLQCSCAAPIDDAQKLVDEQSWQLAREKFDAIAADNNETSFTRRKARLNSIHTKIRQFPNNVDDSMTSELQQIVDEDPEGRLAPFAMWHLATVAGRNRYQYDETETTQVLQLWKNAEAAMERIAPDAATSMYYGVIADPFITARALKFREVGDFLISAKEKILAAAPADDLERMSLAKVSLSRTLSQIKRIDESEMIRQYREIATEFKGYRGAIEALFELLTYYTTRNAATDYVKALTLADEILSMKPDSQTSERVQSSKEMILRRELSMVIDHSVRPGEALSMNVFWRNCPSVKLQAIPFELVDTVSTNKKPIDMMAIKGSSVWDKTLSADKKRTDTHEVTTATVELKFDNPGTYAITATDDKGKRLNCALLVVSDIVAVHAMGNDYGGQDWFSSGLNSSGDARVIWTVDAKNGVPRQQARVLLLCERSGQSNKPEYFIRETQTDENGFADLRSVLKEDNGCSYEVIVSHGKSVAILSQNGWWNRRSDHAAPDQYKAYIYQDRPVYKPGEDVRVKVLIRRMRDGVYVLPPSDRKYTVRVVNPKNEETVSFTDQTVNEMGTLSVALKLPLGTPLGTYRVEVEGMASGNFVVEEYRKPEYEVKVSMPTVAVKEGETAKVTVDSHYYHGAPVVGAEVSYKVRRSRHWWSPWRYLADSHYSWFDMGRQDDAISRRNNFGTIIAEGTGKTDENGKFELSFKGDLTPREASRQDHYWWMPWNPMRMDDFVVEASVMDSSRRSIDGVGRMVIGEKAMTVLMTTQRRIVAPEDLFEADVKAESLSGNALNSQGTVYIEKLEWKDDAKEDYVTTLTSFALNVESSGTTLKWRVSEKEAARLRAVYITKDEFGEQVVGQCLFTVAGADTSHLLVKCQGIEVSADSDVYEVGQTAKVLVTSEFTDATVWWYLEGPAGMIQNEVKPLKYRTNLLELPITENMIPNCKLTLIFVNGGQVYKTDLEFTVPPIKKILNLSLKTDKAVYKPGETAKLNLSVTDWAGKPVQGEFSLSIYDKSIEYIASDMREDIRKYFYGRRAGYFRNVIWSGQIFKIGINEFTPFLNRAFNIAQPMFRINSPRSEMSWAVKSSGTTFAYTSAFADLDSAAMPALVVSENSALEQVVVRDDFRDSVLWLPVLKTDADGKAQAEVTWPDSLTTWKATCVGITDRTLVGETSAEAKVTKELMVRLSAAPFLCERDTATVSAIVNNYRETTETVSVKLTASGVVLKDSDTTRKVEVAPNGESRLDWQVNADKGTGEAEYVVQAVSASDSDGMKMIIPLKPYGADKFVGQCGMEQVKGDVSIETSVTIPIEQIKQTSRLTIQLQPSLAMALRDALPSLVDYPYGCVEQTMNRFVPAAVVSHAFTRLGIPEDPAVEAKLPDVIATGLARLADMQSGDGGWGWWKSETSDPYMTAVVLEGLAIARMNDLQVDQSMFDRANECLKRLTENAAKHYDNNTVLSAYEVHKVVYDAYVLSMTGCAIPDKVVEACYRSRGTMNASGLAMLAVVNHRLGKSDEAAVCLRNLQNYAVHTPENGAVHWGNSNGGWFCWWDDPVDATARALRAYLEIDPNNELATGAMRWLAMNRRGCDWKNTKATGQAVLALTEWMVKKHELDGDMTLTVQVGASSPSVTKVIKPAELWKFDGKIVLEGESVADGVIPVKITCTGQGTLFWSVFAEYFTMEEKISSAGNEAFVERIYERVTLKDGQDAAGKSIRTEVFTPLAEGDILSPGDEVRCTLKLRSLNDFSYVLVEDPKPGCLIPVDVRSGMSWRGVCSNTELRATHTAFFLNVLGQGSCEIEYRLRAEMPGTYHAMPASISAMYVPEVKGNSTNAILGVQDK